MASALQVLKLKVDTLLCAAIQSRDKDIYREALALYEQLEALSAKEGEVQ